MKSKAIRRRSADDESDDTFWKILTAGALGAMMASPSADQKQKLALFDQYEPYLREFIAYRPQFLAFQKHAAVVSARINSLQKIVPREAILKDAKLRPLITEAYSAFGQGFFRSSIIMSACVIELLLRRKYGRHKLVNLIEQAKTEGLISPRDYHHLQALRLDRNDIVHELGTSISEDEAKLYVNVAIRIVNELVR